MARKCILSDTSGQYSHEFCHRSASSHLTASPFELGETRAIADGTGAVSASSQSESGAIRTLLRDEDRGGEALFGPATRGAAVADRVGHRHYSARQL